MKMKKNEFKAIERTKEYINSLHKFKDQEPREHYQHKLRATAKEFIPTCISSLKSEKVNVMHGKNEYNKTEVPVAIEKYAQLEHLRSDHIRTVYVKTEPTLPEHVKLVNVKLEHVRIEYSQEKPTRLTQFSEDCAVYKEAFCGSLFNSDLPQQNTSQF